MGILENNAVTNKGQDAGPPGPTIPYEDRMGVDKDLALLNWRSEGYEYQGTAAAPQERTNASLRETTQDIDAREKGKETKLESRKKRAANQNRRTWTMGTD